MEAAEGAVAERPEDIVACYGTLSDMAAAGRAVVPFQQLMRCDAGRIHPQHRYAWVEGHALVSRGPLSLPP